MALSQEEKDHLRATLDSCDAALAGKPTLGKIFGRTWRAKSREQILNADSLFDVGVHEAYYAPCLSYLPSDYQQRIEEGAAILLARLKGWARKDFVSRLRDREPASALEELLLARGFVKEFGEIGLPPGNRAARRPEFTVLVGGHHVAIEARGLMNSRTVQQLNQDSWRSGQHCWISSDPTIGDSTRGRSALAEKMLESANDSPRITVLTLYSAFDALVLIDVARQMAMKPESSGIPRAKYPLAVAVASNRLLQGIWFNAAVVQRLAVSEDIKDPIRRAIKNSLYPRGDGVLLNEQMSDEEHNRAMWETRS